MSTEKAKLMEQELTEKRKLTSEVKKNISLKLFINSLLAIIVMGVFFIVNCLFVFKSKAIFQMACRIISILGMLGTIVLFEIGYKKNRFNYAISGIELLISSIFIMFIPHLYYVIAIKYVRVLIAVPIILAIYYLVKSIVSYKIMAKQYYDSLSDVKQILEKEDNSYLDDEHSTKTIKERKAKEAEEQKKTTVRSDNTKRNSKKTLSANNKNTKSSSISKKSNTNKAPTKKTNYNKSRKKK